MSEQINEQVNEQVEEQVVEENKPVQEFTFGEKKVDKKKRGAFFFKVVSAAICIGVFLVNGIIMGTFEKGYTDYVKIVPDFIQIIIIIASLYSVSIIANIVGGEKEEPQHTVKEET